MHMVFTYGTLKRGQPNEYKMGRLSSVRFVAEAQTKEPRLLVIGSPWHLPLLLDQQERGKIVRGEVYEVDEESLKCLDAFEEHPNVYRRQQIDVTITKCDSGEYPTNSTLTCWVYFYVAFTTDDLNGEPLECYDVMSTDKKYDTRENLDHPDNRAVT